MTTPVEHQWFLARYVADDLRGETRNVGVILRAANDKIPVPRVRLLDPVPFLRPEHLEEWKGWAAHWGPTGSTWRDHGFWLTKPSKHSPHFFWQMAGSRVCSIVDFDEMFNLLVKPENR